MAAPDPLEPPGVPVPAWFNGVRVDATVIPYRDQVSIVIAPGQLLEVRWTDWLRMTMRVIVARAARWGR